MVIIRRLCNESTSLQRQGQLALWAPIQGQEAAQIGAGRALAPMDFTFPTYRGRYRLVSRCAAGEHASTLSRRQQRWLDPRSTATRCPRSCSAARPCTPSATPWVSSVTRRGGRDWPSSAMAPRARATCSKPSSGPRRSMLRSCLLSEQPVGHLDPVHGPVQGFRSITAHGFGFPGVRVDGNDCSRSTKSRSGPSTRRASAADRR